MPFTNVLPFQGTHSIFQNFDKRVMKPVNLNCSTKHSNAKTQSKQKTKRSLPIRLTFSKNLTSIRILEAMANQF